MTERLSLKIEEFSVETEGLSLKIERSSIKTEDLSIKIPYRGNAAKRFSIAIT